MGGKLIAAPYSSFNWDNMDRHVLLNSTPEQIKAWPEYNKDRWSTKNATEPGLDRTLSNPTPTANGWTVTAAFTSSGSPSIPSPGGTALVGFATLLLSGRRRSGLA